MGKNKTFKQKMITAKRRYQRDKAYIKYPDLDKEPSLSPQKLAMLMQYLDKKEREEGQKIKKRGYCPVHNLGLTVKKECPLGCGYIRS